MRYHYEKPTTYTATYGSTYACDHPVYSKCTLYQNGLFGLAVIQQRYNPTTKSTTWGEIDPWLIDDLYLHKNFYELFKARSGVPSNDLYPTMTIRQIMWALKMKPLPKERWETCFDRRNI